MIKLIKGNCLEKMKEMDKQQWLLFNFLEYISMMDIYFETNEEKIECINKFLKSDFYKNE